MRTSGCARGVPRTHRDPPRLAGSLEAALASSLRLAKTGAHKLGCPGVRARFASRKTEVRKAGLPGGSRSLRRADNAGLDAAAARVRARCAVRKTGVVTPWGQGHHVLRLPRRRRAFMIVSHNRRHSTEKDSRLWNVEDNSKRRGAQGGGGAGRGWRQEGRGGFRVRACRWVGEDMFDATFYRESHIRHEMGLRGLEWRSEP
jgi:hypothetical protein